MEQIQASSPFSKSYRLDFREGLNQRSNLEKTARTVGNQVEAAEQQLLAAMKDPENLSLIKEAEIRYNKVMQAYEAFSRIMQMRFQTMMAAIRGLGH